MPKYIVEVDRPAIETWVYAVKADSLDAAIEKTADIDVEPCAIKTYLSEEEVEYTDSHEATAEEWDSLTD